MDFAPYQDQNPETERALSPPPRNRALSPTNRNAAKSPPPPQQHNANNDYRDPYASSPLPNPNHFNDSYQDIGSVGGTTRGGGGGGGGDGADIEGGRLGVDVNLFETSLPLRLDYEAMLSYLLLPPAGAVFLLVIEHKSDYVRYASRIFTKWKQLSSACPCSRCLIRARSTDLSFIVSMPGNQLFCSPLSSSFTSSSRGRESFPGYYLLLIYASWLSWPSEHIRTVRCYTGFHLCYDKSLDETRG